MPNRLAAFGISAEPTSRQPSPATTSSRPSASAKGSQVQVDLLANTDLRSVEEFERLIVREDGDRIVRISDIGRVELGSEEETANVRHNGKDAVYLSVWPLPGANEISVAYALRAELEEIKGDLPPGTEIDLAYDGTVYMENSLKEIATTFTETVVIVGFIVFLFLGSARSALVPLVTIPISLIGRHGGDDGDGLLAQPADAPRDRAVGGPRRRRRHRRGRERLAATCAKAWAGWRRR